MRNFNPMKAKGEPINSSAGQHTSRNRVRDGGPKPGNNAMGAGKQMGPGLHPQYPLTGSVANTGPTGGRFSTVPSRKGKAKARGG